LLTTFKFSFSSALLLSALTNNVASCFVACSIKPFQLLGISILEFEQEFFRLDLCGVEHSYNELTNLQAKALSIHKTLELALAYAAKKNIEYGSSFWFY